MTVITHTGENIALNIKDFLKENGLWQRIDKLSIKTEKIIHSRCSITTINLKK